MPNANWKESSDSEEIEELPPHTLRTINSLPPKLKLAIYAGLAPDELVNRFHLDLSPDNPHIADYLKLNAEPGASCAEISLFHQPGFPDPLCNLQITDTSNGPLHVLFFTMSDPYAPRFDIDRLPDGTPTHLGAQGRNLAVELAAMQAGLAPGQVRAGLHLFGPAVAELERFVASLGHEIFFAQPLYYHNAVIFENYGFAYAKGRRLMDRIQQGFAPAGEFATRLDGSTPFRTPEAAGSVRLRSWALHDGLLEVPFTDVTMYKQVGQHSEVSTCPGCGW